MCAHTSIVRTFMAFPVTKAILRERDVVSAAARIDRLSTTRWSSIVVRRKRDIADDDTVRSVLLQLTLRAVLFLEASIVRWSCFLRGVNGSKRLECTVVLVVGCRRFRGVSDDARMNLRIQ